MPNSPQEPQHGEENPIEEILDRQEENFVEKVLQVQKENPVKEICQSTGSGKQEARRPGAQALPDRPTDEAARQDRIKTLKKLKSMDDSK